jgi:transcriptional regulator with XRE-family HTH domain
MKSSREIKQHLVKNGIKQTWLAKQVGLDNAMLSRWLAGKGNLSDSKIYRIYEVLEVNN